MSKKLITVILCLEFAFNISALANNTDDASSQVPATQEDITSENMIPRGERPVMPPDMANGQRPAMPRGETRTEETTPPESVYNDEENPSISQDAKNNNVEDPNIKNFGLGPRGDMGNLSQEKVGVAEDDKTTQETNKTPNGIEDFVKTYSTPIISVILLVFAFIFVSFYKRKQY